MANGLAAFVAGMGTGYLRAEDKKLERERQDKLDKITFDRADRERRDDIEQQDLKQALATAAAQPQMVDTAQAPTDGMGPVRSADAPNRYQVGATGFADPVAAQAAVTAGQKTPDQVNAAMSGILRSRGLYERANALDADIGRQKLNQIQLKEAELAHLDRETNRQFDEILSKASNWQDGISQILTKTNVGGLEGTQVKPFLSRDGKTVEFKAYLPDGTEKSFGKFPSGADGQIQARQEIMKADPLTKIQWLKEQAAAAEAKRLEGKADAKDARDFALKEAETNANIMYKNAAANRMSALAANGGTGRVAATEDDSEPDFLEGFDAKDAQSKATQLVDKQIEELVASGQKVDAATRAKMINENIFAQRNGYATTREKAYRLQTVSDVLRKYSKDPQKYATAYQQAIASGMTEDVLKSQGFDAPAKPQATVAATGVVQPAPAVAKQPSVKVISEAGLEKSIFGRDKARYNIQMPDGTTKVVTADELEKLGMPTESIGGIKRYSPNYK